MTRSRCRPAGRAAVCRRVLPAAAGVVLAAGELSAQAAPAAPAARVQAQVVEVRGRAPTVDGRLDEAVWQVAPVLTGLTQRLPREGAPATERTEVRFLHDDDALYVGARMYKDDPSLLQAPVSRRDNATQAERILVSLDTYLDRRTAYTFGVTAGGVRLDWYHASDSESATDASFDPVWTARVRHDSAGWTAEMRIPFSQLRFTPRAVQTWGVNVARMTPTSDEEAYWVMVPPRETGWASRFGELTGIAGVRPSRRVELLPYVASSAAFTSDPGAGNPFNDGSRMTARLGGDLKMGLGPNLTLEATVNPDFGQVEADPAEVNLSAFETFFPERRPFFTEGSRLLSTGNYFYSRRIGAAPRPATVFGLANRQVGDYDFLDEPGNTTILGAAKLTGRLRSGTSVGTLLAVTGAEDVTAFTGATGRFRELRVAPRTAFGVVRTQQEFGGSGSTAGVVFTGVERDLAADDLLAEYLHERAYSGGADWNLRFRGGEYVLSGDAGFSYVAGDSLALLRTQRSPVRYFQRLDAGHVEVDPSRTSLSGARGSLGLAREGGTHWLWSGFVEARSPGFELNDAGAMGFTDRIGANGQVTYRETRPRGPFRSYSLEVGSENQWNTEGLRTWGAATGFARGTFRNFWRGTLGGWVDFPALSDNATRGGPLLGTSQAWRLILGVGSPSNRPTRGRLQLDLGGGEQGQDYRRAVAGISFRPAPRWQLGIDEYYTRWTDPRQYVAVRPGGPAATFGRRYVFGEIDRSELVTQLRATYLFTPELSLEAYVEPYAASGRYLRYGELPATRSRDLRVYGTDGTRIERTGDEYVVTDGAASFTLPFADFNVRSLRSNAVLRWEWRPGSTLFAVWQQDRFSDRPVGDLVGPGAILDTFRADGDNYLIVKATYWIPLR
ncbi:MAG TPA: DUF5916 domain-containing protein [Longimicrobiaceae bacterium]|nr:DUF5916 domain-containing protein [Longimicrobiaceae bacterium]